MRKIGRILSFSCGSTDLPVLDQAAVVAKREGVSFSRLVMEAIQEYVKNHGKGNPQLPLILGDEAFTLAPLQRRKENLEWIKDLVAKNPGVDEVNLASRFAEETGLRLETVREYIQLLIRSHGILKKGSFLYPSKRE